MLNSYLSIPLTFDKITQTQRQSRCTLEDSLKQHIHLLIRSQFRENRFDDTYGCMIWEKDFETIKSVDKWKTELHDSIQTAVRKHEVRLCNINISIGLDDLKIIDPRTRKVIELRRRINVFITGTINQTNEAFKHTEHIFFSPLSLT